METSSARSIPHHSSVTPAQSQPSLDGALLSPLALFLIGCGVFGGVLFAAMYLDVSDRGRSSISSSSSSFTRTCLRLRYPMRWSR
jgi:hypothetical protein